MRTAVIGVGVIGKVHLGVLKEQGREIVAICDVNAEKTQAFPDIPAYSDYREMIEKERPDVVHICTPHYLHADMVVYALERNINVLCEKPLCIKNEDIARILEAEEKSSAQLGVGFQNRYSPCNAYVKEYLKDKKATAAIGLVAWSRGKKYYDSAAWRGTKDQEGGGVLINQAIHTLDLLQWFLGMPAYITASAANLSLQGTIEVEDTITLFASGNVNFTMFATNSASSSFPVEIQIKAEKETLRIIDGRVEKNGEIVRFENSELFRGKPCYGNGHAALIDDFYDCVQTGRKFPIDGKEAAKAVRLVLAAYASNGQTIGI